MYERPSVIRQSLYIVGTDTGVGKTRVAAQLLREGAQAGYRAVGMKPVATGGTFREGKWQHEDVDLLIASANVSAPFELICPYVFEPPIAPAIAAARSGVQIDSKPIVSAFQTLSTLANLCIVESAGGVRVPLDSDAHHDMLSIAKWLNLPIVLVVGIRLGAINHARLTVEAIQREGLALIGWYANRIEIDSEQDQDSVIAQLQKMIPAPLIQDIPYQPH